MKNETTYPKIMNRTIYKKILIKRRFMRSNIYEEVKVSEYRYLMFAKDSALNMHTMRIQNISESLLEDSNNNIVVLTSHLRYNPITNSIIIFDDNNYSYGLMISPKIEYKKWDMSQFKVYEDVLTLDLNIVKNNSKNG